MCDLAIMPLDELKKLRAQRKKALKGWVKSWGRVSSFLSGAILAEGENLGNELQEVEDELFARELGLRVLADKIQSLRLPTSEQRERMKVIVFDLINNDNRQSKP